MTEIKGVAHFSIPVSDMPRSKKFYTDIVGCKHLATIPPGNMVFLDAGGFDADYFAYFEDVDLGWRLWVMGERVALCPAAVAYHHHNGTSARFGARVSVADSFSSETSR